MLHPRRANRGAQATHAQPPIGHDSDCADAPACVNHRDEVDAGWHQDGNPVARLDAASAQSLRERRHAAGEFGISDGLLGGRIADRNRPWRSVPNERPQRHAAHRRRARRGSARISNRGLDVRRDRCFQDRQMAAVRKTVQLDIAEPRTQVFGKVIVEHRVPSAPYQPDRNIQLLHPLRNMGDVRGRRMRVVERHVGHEARNSVAPTRTAIRSGQRTTLQTSQRAARQERSAAHEQRRSARRQAVHAAGGRQLDQPRSAPTRWNCDAGVGQHEPRHAFRMVHGPAHCDRSAPVLGDQPDRAVNVERPQQVVDVAHAVAIRTRADPLRVAHRQLVRRDHPMRRRQLVQQPRPQERPRRVAMQADNRHAAEATNRSPIENMPLVRRTVVAGHVDGPRPCRVQTEFLQSASIDRRTPCRHQTISVALVLRPEPMPRHNTRSPGLIWSCTLASVMGTAAGPTLPYFG